MKRGFPVALILVVALAIAASVTGCGGEKAKANAAVRQVGANLQADHAASKSIPAGSSSVSVSTDKTVGEDDVAQQALSKLKVDFGFISGLVLYPETSVAPGNSGVMPNARIWNQGAQPISGLKFLLKDDDNFLTAKYPERTVSGFNAQDARDKAWDYARMHKLEVEAFKKLFTTGVPIKVNKGTNTLNPFGNYSNDQGWFDGTSKLDKPFVPRSGFDVGMSEVSLGEILIVRPGTPAGQDRHLSGYILYKGAKRQLGTLTVHVMYPN